MDTWAAALRLAGIGFFIGSSILLGIFAGHWLDGKLNTEPILVIIGLFLGLAVAFYGMYHMLLPVVNSDRNKENS